MPRPSHPFDLIILIMFGGRTNYEAPHYSIFSPSYHLFLLGSKYSPQHSVLRHSQSMFFT
jgi:hypothetical protein